MFVRRRIKKMRLRKEQEAAALTIQRFCKGYTVNKRYAKQLGDISIMNTLKVFRDMKEQFGVTLSNLLRFHWKVYLRVKKKKAAKKKKGKKGKGKTSRNVVGSSKSMSMTMQPPPRSGSLGSSSSPMKPRGDSIKKAPAKDSATKNRDAKNATPTGSDRKVMAKDNE